MFVKASDIVIPENRFRKAFDQKKLDELKESILRNGLLHPVVVEKQGDKYTLRAGERRFRVLGDIIKEGKQFCLGSTQVPREMVPVTELSELSELARVEVEVEENVLRTDFTWQERIAALARLHELRLRQNPKHTVTATATEVLGKPAQGEQVTSVSNALTVAKHLANPEVAKAKDEKEALKIIKRTAEAAQRAKLAETYDLEKIPHKLLKGESLALLRTLPDHSFDIILTDPPYGVGADNFGSMSSVGHDYEDSYKYWKELMAVFPDESARVAKDKAHLYVFCDPRRFDELSTLLVLANWTVFPTPLIWDKANGMVPFPEHGPRRTYEAILYAWRGDRKTLLLKPDIIRVSPVRELRHGAQKPVELYIDLLSRSARPGDTVLDCFGGTGPVLVAANRLRLAATYIERADNAYNIAAGRASTKEIDDGGVLKDGLEDIPF